MHSCAAARTRGVHHGRAGSRRGGWMAAPRRRQAGARAELGEGRFGVWLATQRAPQGPRHCRACTWCKRLAGSRRGASLAPAGAGQLRQLHRRTCRGLRAVAGGCCGSGCGSGCGRIGRRRGGAAAAAHASLEGAPGPRGAGGPWRAERLTRLPRPLSARRSPPGAQTAVTEGPPRRGLSASPVPTHCPADASPPPPAAVILSRPGAAVAQRIIPAQVGIASAMQH
jgi:hypothetical protein